MIDSLWNENETSRLSRDTSVILRPSNLKNSYATVQSLHGDWKECVRRGEFRIGLFLAFSGGCHFLHLASSVSCGSDVRLCCGVDDCRVLVKYFT